MPFDTFMRHCRDGDWLRRKWLLAGLDPREAEQIENQRMQALGLFVNASEKSAVTRVPNRPDPCSEQCGAYVKSARTSAGS